MNLDTWMAGVRKGVDALLEGFFEAKIREAQSLSPRSVELVTEVRNLTMGGGKRLRPIVAAAAYRAVRGPGEIEATLEVGAALELLQTYLLIHDDWMDEDDERRGGPAVHYAFQTRYDDPHLGASLGVLAGDLASSFSWELFLRGRFPPTTREASRALFIRIHKEVFAGQQLDLMTDDDVERMHDLKTGSYTTRGPAALGALLADANDESLRSLHDWSSPLGIAFQLRDDLLSTFGASDETGKPGDDLRHGKHNAVVAAFRRLDSTDRDRALLEAVWGKPDASSEALSAATEALCGARAEVEKRLAALTGRARKALRDSSFDDEAKQMLDEVTRRLTDRGH